MTTTQFFWMAMDTFCSTWNTPLHQPHDGWILAPLTVETPPDRHESKTRRIFPSILRQGYSQSVGYSGDAADICIDNSKVLPLRSVQNDEGISGSACQQLIQPASLPVSCALPHTRKIPIESLRKYLDTSLGMVNGHRLNHNRTTSTILVPEPTPRIRSK